MGCDIHVHTEVKIRGKWHHYGTPSIQRNYALFALMADVRNYDSEIEPISKPKGLPEDVTFLTKFDSDSWNGDGHSHSHLSGDELITISNFLSELYESRGETLKAVLNNDFGYVFGSSIDGFIQYPEDRPMGVEDFRIVFWFDN